MLRVLIKKIRTRWVKKETLQIDLEFLPDFLEIMVGELSAFQVVEIVSEQVAKEVAPLFTEKALSDKNFMTRVSNEIYRKLAIDTLYPHNQPK